MKKISIPEPCHENWADFTPTQKGAFCGSCQIDVVDFSNKTPDQVKTILQENAGKHMCGRFKKTQLEDLNNDFFAWQNQSTRSFQSKFLYACLVVFGMTLFTGCSSLETTPVLNSIFTEQVDNSNAQLNIGDPIIEGDTTKTPSRHTHKKGKIKYVPEVAPVKVECETPPDSIPKYEQLLGKVAFIEEEVHETPPDSIPESQTLKGNIAIIEEDFIKGDIDISHVPTPPDTTEIILATDTLSPHLYEEFIMGDVIAPIHTPIEDTIKVEAIEDTLSQEVVPNTELYTDEMVDGGLMIDPDFFNYIEDTVKVETADTTNHISEGVNPLLIPESFAPVFSAKLYPNPTNTEANVQINVTEKNLFNIYLYAIDGKQIKAIYDGILEAGVRSFRIDLTAYRAGSYLIVINSEKHKESLRLEKVE